MGKHTYNRNTDYNWNYACPQSYNYTKPPPSKKFPTTISEDSDMGSFVPDLLPRRWPQRRQPILKHKRHTN